MTGWEYGKRICVSGLGGKGALQSGYKMNKLINGKMNCNNFKELTITKNTTEGKQTNKNRTHELQGKLIHICQYLSGKKKKKLKSTRSSI